jgi:hypothetical protein
MIGAGTGTGAGVAPPKGSASWVRAVEARTCGGLPPNRLCIHVSSPISPESGLENGHPARGTPRAQPRDVRSAGRDTWILTGEALSGPRKRSGRWCSFARSGRRFAFRGAHPGDLDRPEHSDPAASAPIRTSAPYFAADASNSSCAAGARRLPKGSRRAVGAAGVHGTCSTESGRSCRSDRTVGSPTRLGRSPLQAQALPRRKR